ncbi:hypothetical protein [Gardnerella vaginalis]|uniref:hypothetical protein n=1 Tax=Gardnerella vaginalis TaxID=2702 RepID=UPI0039EF129F
MSDVNINSNDAFKLKECYEFAARFEKLDAARKLLREKSKNIDISNYSTDSQNDVSLKETDMQVISQAIRSLSLEDLDARIYGDSEYREKIDNLPDSPEKDYVRVLMTLKHDANRIQDNYALNIISSVIEDDPTDPRYIALANVLQELCNRM